MVQQDIDIRRDPVEKELDVPLTLAEQMTELKRRVTHLETLEAEAADFVALDKTELTAPASTITFASIPGIYAILKIIAFARTDRAGSGADNIAINFNNDTGNNYDFLTSLIRHNAVLTTSPAAGTSRIVTSNIAGSLAPANVFSSLEFIIPDYTGSNHKVVQGSAAQKSANNTTSLFVGEFRGWWRDTSIITEIDLTPNAGTNFVAGSKFYLYGIRAS